MKNNKLISQIYENMDCFYLMTLCAAFTSTYNSREGDRDANAIIKYIGAAYGLSSKTTADFSGCILGQMMNIGLITDYHALCSSELMSEDDQNNMELYEIKGRALEEIAATEGGVFGKTDPRSAIQARNAMKYDYFHHPYSGELRLWQLERNALSGNVNTVRQLGLFYALGIGCEKQPKKAERCFLKCILWGDSQSALLLAELYETAEDTERKGNSFRELYSLISNNGGFAESCRDDTAVKYHKLIKMIRCLIIFPRRDPYINHGLADELLNDKITYTQKKELIAGFEEKSIKNVFLKEYGSGETIGFRVNKNE